VELTDDRFSTISGRSISDPGSCVRFLGVRIEASWAKAAAAERRECTIRPDRAT